jgi:DNA-binding MarR family transcriptional regulator
MSASAPPSTHLDAVTIARLRSAIGRLQRLLRATPSSLDAGLTPTRISLLLNIDRRGPVRLSDVGSDEGLNPTMLSRSISQLVDAGFVQRSSDDGDRRAAWVSITADGHALAERLRAERTETLNRGLEGLPEQQRQILAQSIDALEALAEQLRGNR